VPILYILIWISSLFIGVAGYLPQAKSYIESLVIAGWTVYTIFLLDTLVYLVDMNAEHYDKQFGSNIFLFLASFLFLVGLTIYSTWLLQRYTDHMWLIIMLVSMALCKAAISFFANNLKVFLYKNKGDVLYSQL